MIDVSRVDWDDLHTNAQKKNSVHAPLEICGDPIRMNPSERKLIVSHYAGTWEQFSFRQDAREGTIAESMIGQEVSISAKQFICFTRVMFFYAFKLVQTIHVRFFLLCPRLLSPGIS
jgi:hypothetical protein